MPSETWDRWERTRFVGIYRRQGSHGPIYKVRHRDPAGRQRSQTFSTIEAARKHQRSILHRRDIGQYPDPDRGRETLREVFERYLASRVPPKGARRRAPELAPSTRALYESLFRTHVPDELASQQIRSIAKPDITGLLSRIRRDSTREHVYAMLRAVLASAVSEDLIEANPAATIGVKKATPRAVRFMSAEEVDRLVDEHPERYRAFVLLACWCGPRFGELSALRIRDLDFLRRRLTIAGAVSHVRGKRIEGATKTGKIRSIPVPKSVWGELERHLEEFVDAGDPDALVFTAEGGPIRPDNYRQRVFEPAADRAKIRPRPRFHDTRHTAASLMAQSGYTLFQAQAVLGHSTQYMTAHYTHLFPEDLDALTARLDAAREEVSRRRPARVSELPTGREPQRRRT